MGGGSATSKVGDLFAFVPGPLAPWMAEVGLLPWWADPEIRVVFARPLSALTHVLDYALWPDQPVWQHLHSLLWFALAVGLVAWFYRRLLPSAVAAGMAGLLFAVEDAHALCAGWLANRNALLCLVCGTVFLLLHVEWRRVRTLRFLALALIALALGLGCGEATLGAVAYVVAWQVTREEGPWLRRLTPLVPSGALLVIWRLLYDAFGYGARGSGLYVDPGSDPLLFLTALIERWPVLLANQWFEAPVNLWLLLSRPQQVAAALVAAVLTGGVLAIVFGLLRREALARFFALGMALSLVPLCAAFPMDRLLVFTGIGAFRLRQRQ